MQNLVERNNVKDVWSLKEEDRILYNVYTLSPDMHMLLNLLTEKEGIWSAILILSLFDKSFKNEFKVLSVYAKQFFKSNGLFNFLKVRDSQITSSPSESSSRRRDVTIAWNEPKAASFLGQNVPKEHLMYVIEIDPPLDKQDEDGLTLMPACSVWIKTVNFFYRY